MMDGLGSYSIGTKLMRVLGSLEADALPMQAVRADDNVSNQST